VYDDMDMNSRDTSTQVPSRARIGRGAVEARWRKREKDENGTTVDGPSAVAREVTRWRARYLDDTGKVQTRHFARGVDAQKWLDVTMASLGGEGISDAVDDGSCRGTLAPGGRRRVVTCSSCGR
jgi:hypothetical protein